MQVNQLLKQRILFLIFLFILLQLHSNIYAQVRGFGFKYTYDKNQSSFIITAVLVPSPAEKSGLKTGDKIKALNGVILTNQSLDQVQKMFEVDQIVLRAERASNNYDYTIKKDQLILDMNLTNGLTELMKYADSNFNKLVGENLEKGSWAESKNAVYASTVQLGEKGRTTFIKKIDLSHNENLIANHLVYLGDSKTEAEKKYKLYEDQLNFYFADQVNSLENANSVLRMMLFSRKSTVGFESSRFSLELKENNINSYSKQYEVNFKIIGGRLPLCKPLQPDSSRVSRQNREIINYLYFSFYNQQVEKNLLSDSIKNIDPETPYFIQKYKSKYCIPESITCELEKDGFGDLGDFILKMKWPHLKGYDAGSKFYKLLLENIYHSLSNQFVLYEPVTERQKNVIAATEFAPNIKNMMPETKHTILVTVFHDQPKDEYSFEVRIK